MLLAYTLFIRGMGLSAIGMPSLTAAYASVRKQDLPMATTSLNIVQRLGGPTLKMLRAIFLGWRLRSAQRPLQCIYRGFFSALCVTRSLVCCRFEASRFGGQVTEQPLEEELPGLLAIMSE